MSTSSRDCRSDCSSKLGSSTKSLAQRLDRISRIRFCSDSSLLPRRSRRDRPKSIVLGCGHRTWMECSFRATSSRIMSLPAAMRLGHVWVTLLECERDDRPVLADNRSGVGIRERGSSIRQPESRWAGEQTQTEKIKAPGSPRRRVVSFLGVVNFWVMS